MPSIYLSKTNYDRLQKFRPPGISNNIAFERVWGQATKPAPTPTPTTIPITCLLVVPKDYPLDAWNFGTGKTWWDAEDVFRRWIEALRNVYETQAGLTFDYTLKTHHSQHTSQELATPPPGDLSDFQLDGCSLAPIPEGQGMHLTSFFNRVWWGELGMPHENFRLWAQVIGSGGWAGGNHAPNNDTGYACIGDWQLRAMTTGQCDPCCVGNYPNPRAVGQPGPCTSNGAAFAHECLHSLGVSCHPGDVLPDGGVVEGYNAYPLDPDNHLLPGQIMQLKEHNSRFLRGA